VPPQPEPPLPGPGPIAHALTASLNKSGYKLHKGKKLKPGRYNLALTVTGVSGAVATDSAKLKLKR
jgi:hypothetical protein